MKMVNDDDDDGNGDNDNNKMCENRIRKFGNFMVLYQKLVSWRRTAGLNAFFTKTIALVEQKFDSGGTK